MNPYARPYGCPRCRDSRTLTRSSRAAKTDLVPCEACGLLNADEYERFRRDMWVKNSVPPAICELDLTEPELDTFKKLKVQNPLASKLTVLAWIEGQRYDPSKDPDFLQDARQKFRDWKHRVTP